MKDLIERLEKATGPDRELDAQIMVATNSIKRRAFYLWISTQPKGTNPSMIDYARCAASKYTASIDAALTLVPKGMELKMKYRSGYACANVGTYNQRLMQFASYGFSEEGGHFRDPSPAIAICIAALKARQTESAE